MQFTAIYINRQSVDVLIYHRTKRLTFPLNMADNSYQHKHNHQKRTKSLSRASYLVLMEFWNPLWPIVNKETQGHKRQYQRQ